MLTYADVCQEHALNQCLLQVHSADAVASGVADSVDTLADAVNTLACTTRRRKALQVADAVNTLAVVADAVNTLACTTRRRKALQVLCLLSLLVQKVQILIPESTADRRARRAYCGCSRMLTYAHEC